MAASALPVVLTDAGPSASAAVAAPGISAPPNVVVGEADGYIDLPVRLNAPGTSTVTVNYSTPSGTGTPATNCGSGPRVYEAVNGTLTFTPGETTQDVRVPLLNCQQSLASGFFTFFLDLSGNCTDSTIQRAITQIDVTGDAPAATGVTPGLYALSATVDATAGSIDVPVLLGGPTGAAQGTPVTVNYSTHDGTAIAGTDYTTTKGTLTFPPGETTQNITVPITEQTAPAPTRNFTIKLYSPTNATIAASTATITIGASGTPPLTAPGISAPPNVVVGEADGYIDLPVRLNAPGTSTVTVNYSTPSGTGTPATNCGSGPRVYEAVNGTLTFTPGETTQDVRVPLLNCDYSGSYWFSLTLSNNSADSTIQRATTRITTEGRPRIRSITPTSGGPGTTVTITGRNLEGAVRVTIGGVPAKMSSDARTKLTVTVPTGAVTGRIRVTTPGGSATSAAIFTVT